MRRLLVSACLLGSVSLPATANAYRLWEDCPGTPPDADAQPVLRTPLAAGGEAGTSRCDDRAPRWFDLNFWAAPRFTLQEGYEASATRNYSAPPGFRVRRARIILHGQAHPLLQVRFEADVATGFNILDAYLLVPFRRYLNVQAGQFRVPFGREELLSSARWQFTGPNLWTDAGGGNFVPSFDLGAMVWGYVGPRDLVEYYAGIFNGEGPAQQANLDSNFLYAGRVVVNPLGRPRRFQEADLEREGLRVQIALDGAYQKQQLGFYTPPGASAMTANVRSLALLGAEVAVFWEGLSVYAEMFYRDRRDGDTATEPSTESFGVEAQAGYFIPVEALRNHLEVVARFQDWAPSTCLTRSAGSNCTEIHPASVSPTEYRDAMHTRAFTFGANWYQLGHGLKLQFDYTIYNQLTDLAAADPTTGSTSGVVHANLWTLQALGSF